MSDSEHSYYSAEADELTARLDECLLARAARLGPAPTMAELHELGHHIAMHEYLTTEYRFEKCEAERLLRFRDPLEVVVGCTELGCTIYDLNVAFYLDRADPEESYPMLPDGDTSPQERETNTQKNPARNRPARKGAER